MRMSRELNQRGKFRSADVQQAVRVRDEEYLRYGKWCAYSVVDDDHPITVLMFDHPENFKSAVWFNMTAPFAYLSASLPIDRESYVLKAGESLTLRYGLAVADRELTDQEIKQFYDDWLKSVPRD